MLATGEVVVSLATNIDDRTLRVGTCLPALHQTFNSIDYASRVTPAQRLFIYSREG
jgi:hypothetical protein